MRERLGEILLKLGYVTRDDLERALELQKESGGKRKIGEILCDFILKKEDLLRALTLQKGAQPADASVDIVSQILSYRLERKDIKNLLSTLSKEGEETFMGKIANILEKIAAFIEVSNELSCALSLDDLLKRIIDITIEAIGVDRSTLFLNDKQNKELFSRVAIGELTKEIRFPNNIGIAGSVFTTGQTIVIHDAYSDHRFNREIDMQTGYRTVNILCSPIKTRAGETIGVIQLLNKKEGSFSNDDLVVLEAITSQASVALQNAQIFDELQKAKQEETKMLEVTTAISSELQLKPLLLKIMDVTTDILDADRSTLFMHDEKTNELWSVVAQGEEQREIRFKNHLGIAGSVFVRGKTINIPDAYQDERFNPEVDKKTGYCTRSILCMPVKNKTGKTIGVTQVLNKRDGPFTAVDEKRLLAFSSQASIAIENAKLFEDVLNMKNYNESILESMKSGVLTIDSGNRIVKINSAAIDILNTLPEKTTGLSVDEFFGGKNHWVSDNVRKVRESGTPHITMDTELFISDGNAVSVNLNVVPLINIKNETSGAILIFENITKEKRLKSTMARYLTKEVAEKLLESDETVLGGQLQMATVFFSDIRSFTRFSEKVGAKETVSMLNEYFTLMVDIVLRYEGVLDKYIGDAKLAVFGIPFSTGQDEDNAVKSAIDMRMALKEFNNKRQREQKEPINIGIGISTDEVLVGNIGSMKRMDYTVIGDGVNLASRLEGANKHYMTNILISEFTFNRLKGRFIYREVDSIKVKGKTKPVKIYEILDYHDEKSFPRLNEVLNIFQKGIGLYRQGTWDEAIKMFTEALRLNPTDGLSQIYLDRCRYFLKNPPEENWDGVWEMKTK